MDQSTNRLHYRLPLFAHVQYTVLWYDGTMQSLERIFPCGLDMALIVDDRDDVWRGQQANNLLLVRPYKFFMVSGRGSDWANETTLSLSGLTSSL